MHHSALWQPGSQGNHLESYTSSLEYLCILLEGIALGAGLSQQVAQLFVGFGITMLLHIQGSRHYSIFKWFDHREPEWKNLSSS